MTVRNFLAYCDDLIPPTEQLFLLIPADKIGWKPTENSFTLGQQIAHISGALGVYGHGIVNGEWGFKSMRERFVLNRHTPSMKVEDAVANLRRSYGEFKTLLCKDIFQRLLSDHPRSPPTKGTSIAK